MSARKSRVHQFFEAFWNAPDRDAMPAVLHKKSPSADRWTTRSAVTKIKNLPTMSIWCTLRWATTAALSKGDYIDEWRSPNI